MAKCTGSREKQDRGLQNPAPPFATYRGQVSLAGIPQKLILRQGGQVQVPDLEGDLQAQPGAGKRRNQRRVSIKEAIKDLVQGANGSSSKEQEGQGTYPMGLYLRAASKYPIPGTAGLLGLWSLESCESLQAKRCSRWGWKTSPGTLKW